MSGLVCFCGIGLVMLAFVVAAVLIAGPPDEEDL
jgi:hypothetical protein